MSHDRDAFELQLSELLDGRLAEDEARAVREHLDSCDECRARYAELTGAMEVLRATPRPPVPPGLLQEIQRTAALEMAAPQPTIWERWRYSAVVAAAAAAVLLAFLSPWSADLSDAPAGLAPADSRPIAALPQEEAEEAEKALPAAPESAVAVEAPLATMAVAYAAAPARAERPHRVERARGRQSTSSPAASGAATPASGEAAVPPAESASQPALAMAPAPARAGAASGPVLGEVAGREQPVMPRITVADEPQPPQPSAVEVEMAGGVIAAMLLDQYVAEHMVQSSSAMVSVITDTPATELGPALARDDSEAGSFSVCFTDAMRRALAESENRIP